MFKRIDELIDIHNLKHEIKELQKQTKELDK